jgi:aspartate racemase
MQPPLNIKHIGIVGCSAEGAALCYRTLCAEGQQTLGPHGHPEISMHTPSLASYVNHLRHGNLDGVAALMLDSAHKLAAAGADFLICPDNTIHQAFDRMVPRSPLPWLHIADVVVNEAKARGFRRTGILGTAWLVASEVYPAAFERQGLDWCRPTDPQRDRIGQLIMSELVQGVFRPETVAIFQDVIRSLAERGCDSVVLGCTEIPLIIGDHNASLPTLDSTRLLARAALRKACG